MPDPAAAALDPYTANGVEWQIAGTVNSAGFAIRSAFAEIDGKGYILTIIAPEGVAEQVTQGMLYPALDAFEPTAGS
jgi:hypothetical protein